MIEILFKSGSLIELRDENSKKEKETINWIKSLMKKKRKFCECSNSMIRLESVDNICYIKKKSEN